MKNYHDNFATNVDISLSALVEYFSDSREKKQPAIRQHDIETIISNLQLDHLIKQGGLELKRLQSFIKDYLKETTRLHHPGYLAHQVAASHPTGAIGSLIDGATNNAMAIYEMGPAAASIEYFMINWMMQKVGWETVSYQHQLDPESDHAGGVLTHGGSLANLTALLAARSARLPDFWEKGNPGNVVVLVPEQSHYSIKRSIGILGLGTNCCIAMPADEDGRADPERIAPLLVELKQQGKIIMALVANACGTAAGLYDPLEKIADLCEQHDIWLHIDAAHGGGALVSDNQRHLIAGIERAQSIVWDAHKMLMTPTLCAAVLVNDHRHLDAAFETDASYLLHEKEQPGIDYLSRTIECTKAGLGLKFFMTIAAIGEKGLAEHIEHLVGMSQQAAKVIAATDGFTVAIQPETNILCFRYGDDDDLQMKIRVKLLQKGDFYISTTLYKGLRWLRLVFMNNATTIEDIKQLLSDIVQLANSEK